MPQRVDEALERLRDLELFRECDDDDLGRVAALAHGEVHFEAGDVLYREGDPARDCYVIVEGEVDVTVAGRFVGSVGEGESVGEMGLLDRSPRTATVVARSPVTAQLIEAEGFDRLLDEAPSVTRALLRQVSRWLRARGETVARLTALADETTLRIGSEPSAAPKRAAPRPDQIGLDPDAPGFYQNPYEQYAVLREHDPVHYDEGQGTWLVSRYEDVLAIGRNKALTAELEYASPGTYVDKERARLALLGGRQTKMMFRRDPPDHTRLRRQVYHDFTPKAVKALRPRLQALVDEHLEHLAEKGEADLIHDFAFPLPLIVISEMLGMPRGDDGLIHAWSHAITKALDQSISEADEKASVDASNDMAEYLIDVIEAKRKRPADGLLSSLIAIQQQKEGLSEDELVDQLMLLYIAGHETTVNLIGNGTYALLRQRDQLDRLLRDPVLEANAVEELLRYDSPAQFTRRIAREDVEIGGKRLEAGSVIFTLLGAANRDPAKWGDSPDTLDVTRKGAHEHVSFGGGIHHCLGASLVRLEGQIALGSLVRRFPRMELVSEPAFGRRMTLRGLDELRLSLGT